MSAEGKAVFRVSRAVDWNEQADMYSEFSFSELGDTRAYLEAIGVLAGETLLDVCCGAGRVSVVAADMGLQVTGIDSSPKMLSHARANAEEHGVAGRCEFRLLDWNHVLVGQNLDAHDVVVASRCHAMMDVEKLSALAKRTVGVQIFANAPSIPALLDVLFSGCEGGVDVAHGPGAVPAAREGARPDRPGAPEAVYLKIAEAAYRAGYDPNVRVFPERFRRTFPDEDEALEWVCALKPERASGSEGRVAENLAPFLERRDGGVEFCIATKAAIIWWDVRRWE